MTPEKNAQRSFGFAFDKASVRKVDENGFLHVAASHITKAAVNPYYGREVPDGVEHGFHPEGVYYGLRDPEELQKSLPTWAGLPLHAMHHMDSADDPQKGTRVGSVGTAVVWNAPYVDADLTVWDGAAIDAVNAGTLRELSCAYRYDPEFKSGEFEGKKYDFIMRNIRGNHVALVEEGRAGPDVLVADQKTVKENSMKDPKDKKKPVGDALPDDELQHHQDEVDLAQAIIDLHKVDPTTGQVTDMNEDEAPANELRSALGDLGDIPPEKRVRIVNALKGLALHAPEPNFSEEFKAAMANAGLDAENPELAIAFAKGMAHGEKGKGQPADKPGEGAPGTNPAPADCFLRGKDAEPAAVPAPVPGDKPEPENTAPKKEDDPVKPDIKPAAQDAQTIKDEAVRETKAHMKALFEAVEKVRPVTGNLDPMTFDSAEDVYGACLKANGFDITKYDRAAWRGMADVVLAQRFGGKIPAQDSRHEDVSFDGAFAGLKTVTIS